MNTELATAFARETVDAIRRALAPLSDHIKKLDDTLAEVVLGQAEFVLLTTFEDVTGKIAADAQTAIATGRKAIDARLAEIEGTLTCALGKIVEHQTGLAAQIDARLAAWEKQRPEPPPPDFPQAARVDALAEQLDTLRRDVAQIKVQPGPPGEGFRYRGVFDAEGAYLAGDWVTHEGTLWAALTASCGLMPGTTEGVTAWRMAMKRPRDGANGVGLNWRGAYAEGELYRLNDVVKHTGRVFICRKSTSLPPPLPGMANGPEWALMLEG